MVLAGFHLPTILACEMLTEEMLPQGWYLPDRAPVS
jgi:hypothetical protein